MLRTHNAELDASLFEIQILLVDYYKRAPLENNDLTCSLCTSSRVRGKYHVVSDEKITEFPLICVNWHSFAQDHFSMTRNSDPGTREIHFMAIKMHKGFIKTSERINEGDVVIDRKSLPSRTNNSCRAVVTRRRRSPVSPSRIASPSSTNNISSPSGMPGSISSLIPSKSQENLTFGHSSHSSLAHCWNIPGPICRVTILCLQLHLRIPFAGSTKLLSCPRRKMRPRCKSFS